MRFQFFQRPGKDGAILVLLGEAPQIVERRRQVFGLAPVERRKKRAGIVEAEPDAEPILRVGMPQEGGGRRVVPPAPEREPGRQQPSRRGGGQRHAVGEIKREALGLQAAGEGPGVIRIGRADGHGAVFPVRFAQQRRQRFRRVGRLLEDMDLSFVQRQRLVFPAAGHGATPVVETIRLRFRGQDMQLHRDRRGQDL